MVPIKGNQAREDDLFKYSADRDVKEIDNPNERCYEVNFFELIANAVQIPMKEAMLGTLNGGGNT